MIRIIKNSIFIIVIFCLFFDASAQTGYRFSQYMFNELSVNPAYAGTKDGIITNLAYRNQWVNLKGAPVTQMLTSHFPIAGKSIGLGAMLINEQIGIINDLGFFISYAYQLKFTSSILSLGINAGMTNKYVQWDKIYTYPTPQTDDPTFNTENLNIWLPNFGVGLYFYSNNYYLGASMPKLLANEIPNDNLISEYFSFSTKNINYYFTGGYVFSLEKIAFKPSFMIKSVKNTPTQYDINANAFFKNGLGLGFGFHSKDALVFLLGYQFSENLQFSYSYDLTLTDLSNVSNGSHEIILSYKVPTLKQRIVSPRFF